MIVKYLLSMSCGEQGYWDTSGYCHWNKKAFHQNSEFYMNEEECLIKAIASFIEEYPQGDYEIYTIQSYNDWNEDYDEDENEKDNRQTQKIADITHKAFELSKEIKEKKRLLDIENKKRIRAIEQEGIKQDELKMLAKLKAKHEKGIS